MNRKEVTKPKTYTQGKQLGSARVQKEISPLDNNLQMPFKSGRKRNLTSQSSRNHVHEKKLINSKIYFYKHLLCQMFCKTFKIYNLDSKYNNSVKYYNYNLSNYFLIV